MYSQYLYRFRNAIAFSDELKSVRIKISWNLENLKILLNAIQLSKPTFLSQVTIVSVFAPFSKAYTLFLFEKIGLTQNL